MVTKKLADFKGLGGLDTRVNRVVGSLSAGYNFYTRNKALFSRSGLEYHNPLISQKICIGKLPGSETVIISQNDLKLSKKVSSYFTNDTWVADVYTLTDDAKISTCLILGNMIIVNGKDRVQYKLSTGVFSTLVRLVGEVPADDAIPEINKVITWKSRLFGWATSGTYSTENGHLLRFSGYDDTQIADITYWPPDFMLNIGGEDGSSIRAVFPCDSHLLCLTATQYVQVFGDDETNFTITRGGNTQVLNEDCCIKVGNVVYWIAKDITDRYSVMRYTGTEPVKVSYQVDSLLDEYLSTGTFMREVNNQVWIVCPGTTDTTIIIYDSFEEAWFTYVLPVVVTDLVYYNTLVAVDAVIVVADSQLYLLNDQVTNDDVFVIDTVVPQPIVTSFTIGPISLSGIVMKCKSLYITALPNSDYTITVSQVVDSQTAASKQLTLEADYQNTQYLKLAKIKGKNVSFKVTSEDAISNLFDISFVYNQKAVK